MCLHLTSCLLEFSLFGFLLCPLAASTVLCSSFFNRAKLLWNRAWRISIVGKWLYLRAREFHIAISSIIQSVGCCWCLCGFSLYWHDYRSDFMCGFSKLEKFFSNPYFSREMEGKEWVITLSRLGQQIAQDAKFQIKSFTGLLLS